MSARAESRRFDRSISALPEIAGFIRDYFEAAGIQAAHLGPVQLAVEEVFTNMVKYAAGHERILIELSASDVEVSASLTDFDVEAFDIRNPNRVRALIGGRSSLVAVARKAAMLAVISMAEA